MDRTIEAVFYGRHEADPRALLYFEWRERLESGYPVAGFESAVRALAGAETVDAEGCWALLGEIESVGRDPGWGYEEGESEVALSVQAGRSESAGGESAVRRSDARAGGVGFGSAGVGSGGCESTGTGSESGQASVRPPPPGGSTSAAAGSADPSSSVSFDNTAVAAPRALIGVASSDAGPVGLVSSASPGSSASSLASDELFDRVYGGWLGRCVGCALGKPLENGFVWTREHIRTYLERAGAYPLTDYVPALLPPSPRFPLNPTWPVSARGRIDGAPRDDDIDYTVLGLHLLESRGLNFTADDVAKLWLERIPFLQTYTAERVAYRNLVDGLHPPRTAEVRNPYREWIGAMIRADIFGYVSPGDPERAAGLAAREAAVSHTGNGVFAAMWAAALVAAAFTGQDSVRGTSAVTSALVAAQNVLPPRSRLAIALAEVHADFERGLSWEEAVDDIDARHGGYNWVHAIPNACRVAAGLLWGGGDFTRTIASTVQSGADTDSNGATAGSVAGILVGAKGIPGHWIEPVHDMLHSAVMGYDGVRISELARRTCALV
ncbi:ADP-ribosylglycohydrolase family protein [Nocardia bhagyanarayanae]|uniref:ADP-ribosylglycohydrolase n=1 Tax=Nocardia bhagyanarayanae TaxID=1215925 RepID=A0A543F7M5_9NOCA|nr:ADP-ribosylglycohydrolase family protein [Nocardia bhagyanarayanae]TQM29836.1 ADP-ribosylglycohydrolase [Nocardia bhagyanarayanae]